MITDHAKSQRDVDRDQDPKDSKLERIAKQIVPPSQDVTNDDLKDPGRMTPAAPPTDNRS